MSSLILHDWHLEQGANFYPVNGQETVLHYGEPAAEYAALTESAGIFDLSFRGRLCLTGADNVRFLHGQVTNNVKALKMGQGCYAAVVNAKGKLEGDLNVYRMPAPLWLDFEPGLSEVIIKRFDKFIIADDVQVVEVSRHYGLLSVQGICAEQLITRLGLVAEIPSAAMSFTTLEVPGLGECHLMNMARTGSSGFDWFVPASSLKPAMEKLLTAAKAVNGRLCGWQAMEFARIEAGIPRFGADMDASNLAPEAGIEARAISYDKGCYIGQEVIARIQTYGQVAKALRRLRLDPNLPHLPEKGEPLYMGDQPVGYITSAAALPAGKGNMALGYVRREANAIGNRLRLKSKEGESTVEIV